MERWESYATITSYRWNQPHSHSMHCDDSS